MARKILVTGAAGLIGRELFAYLQHQGHDVTGIDNGMRFSSYKPKGNFFNCDFLYYVKNTQNDFDIIYHMAAINGTAAFYETPNKVIKHNLLTDMCVFDFANTNKKCKLVYSSSSEVVAGTDNFPTSEEVNVNINDLHNARWSYRIPKMFSENYLANSSIDYLILRYFNVYSKHSGKGHFIYDITEKLKSNNFDLVGADETRSFCHVSDAVDATIKVTNASKQVINIGSDEEILIEDAANIIAHAIGVTPTWNRVDSRKGSVKRRCPDISKLRKLYPDFNPMKFKDVISEMYVNTE